MELISIQAAKKSYQPHCEYGMSSDKCQTVASKCHSRTVIVKLLNIAYIFHLIRKYVENVFEE